MAPTVERLTGEPIAVITFASPFNPINDVPQANERLSELSTDVPGTLHIVADISHVELPFEDIIISMAELPGDDLLIARHSDTDICFVGGEDAAEMAQYGGQDVAVYHTLDDALAAIRNKL
jgi:hypothetical protein